MRKPAFCICENKDGYKLHGNSAADQLFCFCYIDSTNPLLPLFQNFKPLTIFCGCTARFVLDLVGNPIDKFFMTRFICLLLRNVLPSEATAIPRHQEEDAVKDLFWTLKTLLELITWLYH